jgi:hypothetical protein
VEPPLDTTAWVINTDGMLLVCCDRPMLFNHGKSTNCQAARESGLMGVNTD